MSTSGSLHAGTDVKKMRSKQKTLTIKQLRNLLENCLRGGLTLALFLPDARNKTSNMG